MEWYDPGIHEFDSGATDHWNRYLFARKWLCGPSVIDVGCGAGYGTDLLSEAAGVSIVLGVDRSHEALFSAVSRQRSRKVEFVHSSDGTFVPLAGRWGTVVALKIWEHLKCPRTAAFCARNGMPANGRLVVSLPIEDDPGQNEHHFTAVSARSLVSEFFEITQEYHQARDVTFVANPGPPNVAVRDQTTVLAFLQVDDYKKRAFRSAIQEISELIYSGLHVVVLCDDPQIVRASTGADAFFLPLGSSLRENEHVSPVHLSAACAFAQWFDVKVIYSAHEFMPLAHALADLSAIPHVIHLRGSGEDEYRGTARPQETLSESLRCKLVADSRSTADRYASLLGRDPESFPVISPRIDFEALASHDSDAVWPEIEGVRKLGPLMLFCAVTRDSAKGFETFLAVAEQIEADHPGKFTFAILADRANWPDSNALQCWRRAGLDQRRVIIGDTTETVGAFYRGASVCVIPSEWGDSFCWMAAEALGMGVSVVGYRGGQLNLFERYGAVLVERGDVRALSKAAVSMAGRGKVEQAVDMQRDYGVKRPSELSQTIRGTIERAETYADYGLIVVVASDGLSNIAPSDWVERVSLIASNRTRVLLVLATSSDRVEQTFREAVGRSGRAHLQFGVVRRENGVKFSFSREVNRAAKYGLAAMHEARGILCANDDTWPSHIALAGVRSWLDRDGLIGAVCSKGAGGIQDFRLFFRCFLNWKGRILNSKHRIAAFWLYVSRKTWIALDGFDEHFEGYGCEDTDFSLRAWYLEKQILIDRACYVDHETGSSYAKTAELGALRDEAIRRFTEKHAMSFEQYHIPLCLQDYWDA